MFVKENGEDMNTREYLEMIHVAEKLKDETRHCTTSNRRVESVAEHSWRIALMAMWLEDEFKDVDINKVIKMCLIHDLGECFTGDIPVFLKTSKDVSKEDETLNKWVQSLPSDVSKQMSDLYEEMNALKTKEAKVYKALDKLEALIQHNESPLDTWLPNEYDLQRTYGWESVEFSSFLKELREDVLKDSEAKIANG